MRSTENPAKYLLDEGEDGYYLQSDGERINYQDVPDEYADSKLIKVVLTVHHIGITHPDGSAGDPNDKLDCRPENLTALCQRCHLRADLVLHVRHSIATRIENRRKALIQSGQLELFTPKKEGETC